MYYGVNAKLLVKNLELAPKIYAPLLLIEGNRIK